MTDSHLEPSIGVVIVAYRSSATIRGCIISCIADPQVNSVVVIDNAAGVDPCLEEMSDLIASSGRVRYVPSSNVGFSAACNLGARTLPAGSTHVAFVNPDVRLTRTLSELRDHLTLDAPSVVAGLLVTPTRPWMNNARQAFSYGRSLRSLLVGADAAFHVRLPRDQDRVAVGQLAGALMMMSREVFEELGGFDERFELYYEDVDLCRRVAERGRVDLVSQMWGVHIGGVSSSAVSGFSYVVACVSRVRYVKKWHSRTRFIFIPSFAVLEWLARSLARRPEGQKARNRAVVLQLQELATPGSVSVLS